jgi:superfamily I DNA and/or RNA helicase
MQNVKQKLSQKLRFLDIGECGTVHALQGRQADIVILVLGSKSGKNGHQTRRWAAAEPNLINVAVSRAVETLVVIGCAADWQCFETMKRIAAELGRFGGGTVESLSDLPVRKEAGLF